MEHLERRLRATIWYNNFAFFDVFRVNPKEIAIEGLPVKIEDQSIRIIVTNNQIDKLIEDLKKYRKEAKKQ